MAGTLVSYLPFTRSVTEDLSGKEWTVTGEPQIINRPDFPVPVAKFEAGEYLALNNLTVGGQNHWLMDFWTYIPQTSSTGDIIWIGGDDWFFTLLRVLDSGKLRFGQNISDDLDDTYWKYHDTTITCFNKWINLKFHYMLYYSNSKTSTIHLSISDGTEQLYHWWIQREQYYITKTAKKLQIGSNINILLSQFRFYTRSNTYKLADFIPNPPTESDDVNIYLPTRQSFAWNEFQVHDTVNFDYSDNINYTTYNQSSQWYYKNIGTADGLLVEGTSLTNVSPLQSRTSKAFYQTNRQKCFDTQASKEIYMLFDVYFDGTNRWRAYEESSTNGQTGITAQTSGVLNIFSNSTNVGASIPLTINKLETYLLHMRSDATNGYIEVFKDGELKYTYIGNVNNGDDFSNLELQSDGSGTIFSNIVISNQQVYDYDRWIGKYTNIQRTLTNETWVPENCLKAYLPCTNTITEDFCGNTWTVTGTTPTIVTTNYLNGKATQFGKGYIYTNPPALRSNNFTIDFWEYIPSTTNGLTAQMVVIDGTDGTGTQCLDIGYDNGATVPSLWLGKGTSSGWIYSNKIIGTKIRGQWVHRAVVRYNDKIYAFENGQLYTSFNIESNMYIDITGSSLFIGGFKRASRLHPGMLSEVRIYVGTTLWTTNFTPPNQEDYFDIYWHFNEPAPILNTNYDIQRTLTNETWVPEKCLKSYLTTINNSITALCGNQWNTYNNPSVAKTNTLNGKAISLSNNAYLQYQNGITLGGRSFTISGWFNMASNTGTWSRIFQLFTTASSETNTIRMSRNSTSEQLAFTFYNASLNTYVYNISYNTWYHFAFVYDHSNSKVYIYINGKQIVSGNQTIPSTTFTLYLGKSNYNDGLFVGQIAEFMIHDNLVLYTENFTPPNQEDYFETYWYFNQPAPILNTNYNTLRYLTNDSQTWKYINPCYNDIDHFTYTNISVTQVQPRISYTDMQLSGDITINTEIYQELWIKFDTYLGNALDTIFSFPYGKGTISISISKPESSTTYLAKIIHERNEENPTGTQLSPETSYSDYELGKIDEEISFIIYIKSDAYNKGEIIIDSSSWIDTNDNRRVAILSTGGRFHLYNANINEGNTLSKTSNVKCIYNLIVSNQELTFDDMIAHNINPAQRSIINNEEWRREKYYYHTYLPFDENVTKDLNGDTWELTNTLDIQNNACYFNGLGYLWKNSNNLANKPFTVSFYMSATSNNTGKEPYIFQLYSKKGFGLIVYRIGCKITTNGKLVFCRVFDDDFKNDFYLSTSFSILDGKMHYIECVYTGSKCLFFVDGMLIGTANSVLKSQNHGLYLGRNADTNTSFTGYLDEFRIYSGYIVHTEAFTPPVYHQRNDKLYYDKSAETMKFEYFADVQKTTWILSTLTTKKVIVSYLPFDDDINDRCSDKRSISYRWPLVFSSQDSTKNKSLSITSSSSSHDYNYIFFDIYDTSSKFIAELDIIANFPGDSFRSERQSIDILKINKMIAVAKPIASISYWNPNEPQIDGQLEPSNVAKLWISNRSSSNSPDTFIDAYTLTEQSKKSFHVTIIRGDEYTTFFLKSLDDGNVCTYSVINNNNINIKNNYYNIRLGTSNTTEGLNINIDEFKFYLDYTDTTDEKIIDKNIEVRFNNGEESVYFEFYADIIIRNPLFLNIAIPNCGFWVNVSPMDGIKKIGVSPVKINYRSYADPEYNISSDKTLFNYTSNNSYLASIKSISYTSSVNDKITFIAWVANSLTESQQADISLTYDPYVLVEFSQGAVTLRIGSDELFTTTMIKNYIYHLAVVIDCGTLKFYLNGQLMYSNSTILPDVIQEDIYFNAESLEFAGLGSYNTNIFDTPNEINLGQIGEPPSYKIPFYSFKQAGPNLIVYHNDTPYYNKLVLPTDENASSIRIYHNKKIYALSK